MREITALLLIILLFLGGCAVIARSFQPTVESAAQALITAETRTDPIDDLVRFRETERAGRRSTLLLPIFVLLTIGLFLLVLATPLPHILKELRLLRKKRRRGRRRNPPTSAWIEPADRPFPDRRPPGGRSQPQLPPPRRSAWLEED